VSVFLMEVWVEMCGRERRGGGGVNIHAKAVSNRKRRKNEGVCARRGFSESPNRGRGEMQCLSAELGGGSLSMSPSLAET